jgi:Flp pilus assembly protein TadG
MHNQKLARRPVSQRTRHRGFRGRRSAAAAVEFAVVSPLLFLVLLGIIECGRMIMVQQSLTTAAREGARIAIVDGTSVSAAVKVVNSFLAASGVSGSEVTVTPGDPSQVTHGEAVTVSVSIPFRNVSWLPSPLFLGNAVLSSTASMRRESPK